MTQKSQTPEPKTAMAAISQQDAELAELYGADLDEGLEGATADSYAIPFLRVLQALSPACSKKDGVEGAEPGRLMNTVTGTIYDPNEDELRFIQATYQQRWLRWPAQRGDGGLRGVYTPEEFLAMKTNGEVRQYDGRWRFVDEGGELDAACDIAQDTRSHIGYIVGPDIDGVRQQESVVIALASTQIRQSKRFMAALANRRIRIEGGGLRTLPTFSGAARLSIEYESNDQGEWASLRFGDIANILPTHYLYAAGKLLRDSLVNGSAEVDPSGYGGDSAYSDSVPPAGDDNTPF